ncbi:hypothetical protein [Metabacillus litoralis]|uniref:hypothetical protein n=1 Tax=Metabacillus litoralis TaxID=152268 RepID=UPI000EF5BEF0|nr:hypothetical protein [Metabacillus litoralis]
MKKIFLTFIILIFTVSFSKQAIASSLDEATKLGKGLQNKLSSFEKTIDSGDIVAINDQYDKLSSEIKKTEKAIGKVSGKSKRDALNSTYVKNAKIARERVIYEVSQYRLLGVINESLKAGNTEKANLDLAKLERLKKRAIEIKKAGGYKDIPTKVTNTLATMENKVVTEIENTSLLTKAFPGLEWGMTIDEAKEVLKDKQLIEEVKEDRFTELKYKELTYSFNIVNPTTREASVAFSKNGLFAVDVSEEEISNQFYTKEYLEQKTTPIFAQFNKMLGNGVKVSFKVEELKEMNLTILKTETWNSPLGEEAVITLFEETFQSELEELLGGKYQTYISFYVVNQKVRGW